MSPTLSWADAGDRRGGASGPPVAPGEPSIGVDALPGGHLPRSARRIASGVECRHFRRRRGKSWLKSLTSFRGRPRSIAAARRPCQGAEGTGAVNPGRVGGVAQAPDGAANVGRRAHPPRDGAAACLRPPGTGQAEGGPHRGRRSQCQVPRRSKIAAFALVRPRPTAGRTPCAACAVVPARAARGFEGLPVGQSAKTVPDAALPKREFVCPLIILKHLTSLRSFLHGRQHSYPGTPFRDACPYAASGNGIAAVGRGCVHGIGIDGLA